MTTLNVNGKDRQLLMTPTAYQSSQPSARAKLLTSEAWPSMRCGSWWKVSM